MTREQRVCESVLLKERWQLIQSGVPRNSIKMKGSCLFVSNKLHGRVAGNAFQHEYPSRDTSSLERPESSRNVVDGPSLVEGEHETDCLIPTTTPPVQPVTTPLSSSTQAFTRFDTCDISASFTTPSSVTHPTANLSQT